MFNSSKLSKEDMQWLESEKEKNIFNIALTEEQEKIREFEKEKIPS